jgi:RimJ/RimL family protein N-acetyltransferase
MSETSNLDITSELVVRDLPKVSFGFPSSHVDFLYLLLAEREEHQNISHKKMPSHAKHTHFVCSDCWKVYFDWKVIVSEEGEAVGSVYLTKRNEIGVQIKKKYIGQGYGEAALIYAMKVVSDTKEIPNVIYANINPDNHDSKKFFEKHNFKLIQVTYKLDII